MGISSTIPLATSQGSEAGTNHGKICIHVLREISQDFRLTRTATALVQAGFTVSLVDIETSRTLQKQEKINGVMMEHVIVPNWHSARRFEPFFFLVAVQTFFRCVIRLMQTKADIYHASELTALPSAFLAASLRRKKLIFEIYDLQFPVPLTHIAFWRFAGASLYRLFLPHCAGVIVTSPYHGSEVEKRYKVSEMALLRNVPAYRDVQKTNRLREYLGLADHIRIALYQGYIQADRELERLVLAARYLNPDIVIVMMGRGMGAVPEQLQALIAQEGVADRVKIIPPAPYAELLDWTCSADIGLTLFSPSFSLSVRYVLPNKFFEYLMAGLPVLSMRLDAIAEVIETYEVGCILKSLELGEIATGINAMLADPDALAPMRQNALKIAREKFNWELEQKELIGLYQRILSRSGSKGTKGE